MNMMTMITMNKTITVNIPNTKRIHGSTFMNMSQNLSLAPGICSKYLEQCQLSEGGGIVLFCGLLESGIRATQCQMMLVGGMMNIL